MTSTLTSPKSLKKQRKDSYYSSYLTRKKRSYEEETYEILTDNYRKNKRFITEIMVQQFSLLTVSKGEKVRELRPETTNKMNHGEYIFRRKLPKIKTCNTILNSPLSQPPIVISFTEGTDASNIMLSNLKEESKPTAIKTSLCTHEEDEDSSMSDIPETPTRTLETSMEESI